MPKKVPVKLRVNGEEHELHLPPQRILLDALREDLNLTGTKRGCDLGTCGCCTVIVEGVPKLSCLMLAMLAEGQEITTIEGIAPPGGLHPVQKAFVDLGATQCGFCTPGFILTSIAFLRDHPHATREEIASAISGNLCRCTGYVKILDAIESAARSMAPPGEA
ncbi:MAG: (2Fe-2S)-binding protein [Euryarchaeota archaeon]|nr:(2Fe-2S)-binding protein [Euryarchaeota archaeon]